MEPVTLIVDFAASTQLLATSVSSISSSISVIFASVIATSASISGMCSALVSVLPHPSSENWYHNVHHILNLMAFNVGNAKNAVTGVVSK